MKSQGCVVSFRLPYCECFGSESAEKGEKSDEDEQIVESWSICMRMGGCGLLILCLKLIRRVFIF